MNCPICGSNLTISIFKSSGIPVYQHQLCHTKKEALEVCRGDLNFCQCQLCSFVFNSSFDPEKIPYTDVEYSNSQSNSFLFSDHVAEIISSLDVQGAKRIVDIGCGNGDFLRRMIAAHPSLIGVGIDPAYIGPSMERNISFHKRYFTSEDITDDDLVICRHVIEHIQDPISFIKQISKCHRLYLETPDIQWTLDNKYVWDFFYEHCSLFSKDSIHKLLYQDGHRVSCRNVFSGQYLFASREVCDMSEPVENKIIKEIPNFINKLFWFRSFVSTKNNCVIWGVGAKGVMFANLIDPYREIIKYGAELNPKKIGCFIPGTAHPIISCDNVSSDSCIFLMNPAYREEVYQRLGKAVEIIDI